MAWQRLPGLLPDLCTESVKALRPMHGGVFLPSHNSWLVVLFVLCVVLLGSSSAGPVNVCAPSPPSCRRAWLAFVVGCHCDLAYYSIGASTSLSLFYQWHIKSNVGCSSTTVPSFVASYPLKVWVTVGGARMCRERCYHWLNGRSSSPARIGLLCFCCISLHFIGRPSIEGDNGAT
jgi:hypothetical protein